MPRDPNQRAKAVLDLATGERKPAADTRDPAAVARGHLGGIKGGQARAANLSPEKRREIAQRAAAARWGRRSTTPS